MAESGQIVVDRVDLAPGWMCFVAKPGTEPDPEKLPYGLSRAIQDAFRQNPNLTVRATCPIVSAGNTVALHVWFD
jgi:hypothetical protein